MVKCRQAVYVWPMAFSEEYTERVSGNYKGTVKTGLWMLKYLSYLSDLLCHVPNNVYWSNADGPIAAFGGCSVKASASSVCHVASNTPAWCIVNSRIQGP